MFLPRTLPWANRRLPLPYRALPTGSQYRSFHRPMNIYSPKKVKILVILMVISVFLCKFAEETTECKNIAKSNFNIMQETRQNKIARLLQKELSVIFQEQTRMMRGVMVSVTRTKVSPDLSICTAYLSIFPSAKGEEILKNIVANDKTIRYELGTRVRHQLRIIPELRFFIDDSLDYIEHIDQLLKGDKQGNDEE